MYAERQEWKNLLENVFMGKDVRVSGIKEEENVSIVATKAKKY